MNRQTKITLIGLAALGLLYSGTVGLGFRSGNDEKRTENDSPPSWTEFMGKVLPEGKPYVSLSEITVSGGQLTNGKATISNNVATVTFKTISDDYLRKVKIKIRSDTPVMLTYKDNAFPTNAESASGKSSWKKDISKSGGTLTLSSDEASTNPYTIEFSGSK